MEHVALCQANTIWIPSSGRREYLQVTPINNVDAQGATLIKNEKE